MIRFFTKCFDAICCIFIVLNFILFGFLGFYCGGVTVDAFYLYDSEVLMKVLFTLLGVAIAFFFNVFVFGFIGQIIDIRKLLEENNKKN